MDKSREKLFEIWFHCLNVNDAYSPAVMIVLSRRSRRTSKNGSRRCYSDETAGIPAILQDHLPVTPEQRFPSSSGVQWRWRQDSNKKALMNRLVVMWFLKYYFRSHFCLSTPILHSFIPCPLISRGISIIHSLHCTVIMPRLSPPLIGLSEALCFWVVCCPSVHACVRSCIWASSVNITS